MTAPPQYPYVAPSGVKPKRRWWLVAVVAAWALVIAVLGFWSVRHDPPTVAEQRDIGQALPLLEEAAGAMLAAASGADRAIQPGPLELDRDCDHPDPGRVEARRAVTVFVRAGEARRVVDEIADRLPPAYRASVGVSAKGGRIGIHADAGQFIGIDLTTDATSQIMTLEASAGCRPDVPGGWRLGSPATPGRPAPPALGAVLRALGSPDGTPVASAVGCGTGRQVDTYTVDGVRRPRDLGTALQTVAEPRSIVRAEPQGWAYLSGADSVVVAESGDALRVSVTTACR